MVLGILRVGSKAKPDYILAVGKAKVAGKKHGTPTSNMPRTGPQSISIEEAPPYLRQFVYLINAAAHESERGAVLVYATMLDEQLKKVIEAFLVSHRAVVKLTEGFNAPIGTFSTRTLLALALGLISEKEYHEIELIRKIRNEFAHSIDMKFEHPSVSSRCKLLLGSIPDYPAPAEQFIASAAGLVLNLLNRAHYAARKRLSYRTWPL